MDFWDWFCLITGIIDRILCDEVMHFTLAFLVGVVVFWLTSTTLFALRSRVSRWWNFFNHPVVDYIIIYSSVGLVLASALLSHYGLDYLEYLYTKPLGPPLELVIPK
jgi:tetrahydromethanopterin S-methyltransferase subunit E